MRSAQAASGPRAGERHALGSRWTSVRDEVRAQFAADRSVPGRRGLQLCLALVWLLDAALQYQPFMFRPAFPAAVIEPSAAGNPRFLSASVEWASQLMLHHLVTANAAFAAIQVLIAVGLVVRRTVKPALLLSIGWALSVWWFGEGLGGLLIGSSPLAGLPGAALLYALIAILVWPSERASVREPTSVATSGPAGPAGATIAWLVLWGTFAHYLLLPSNRAAGATYRLLSDTTGEPGWFAVIMTGLSRTAANRGGQISVVLAILCAAIGLALLARPLIGPTVALAAVIGIVFSAAQGLGGVFTGHGTDPGTGPLLIVLAACYLPRRRQRAPHAGS